MSVRVEERIDEQAAEGIDREHADQCNRGADRAGDEGVALDPSAQRETVAEEDQSGRPDKRRAITQSGLSPRQIAEDKLKRFPSPAVDVDGESDCRDGDESRRTAG